MQQKILMIFFSKIGGLLHVFGLTSELQSNQASNSQQ